MLYLSLKINSSQSGDLHVSVFTWRIYRLLNWRQYGDLDVSTVYIHLGDRLLAPIIPYMLGRIVGLSERHVTFDWCGAAEKFWIPLDRRILPLLAPFHSCKNPKTVDEEGWGRGHGHPTTWYNVKSAIIVLREARIHLIGMNQTMGWLSACVSAFTYIICYWTKDSPITLETYSDDRLFNWS